MGPTVPLNYYSQNISKTPIREQTMESNMLQFQWSNWTWNQKMKLRTWNVLTLISNGRAAKHPPTTRNRAIKDRASQTAMGTYATRECAAHADTPYPTKSTNHVTRQKRSEKKRLSTCGHQIEKNVNRIACRPIFENDEIKVSQIAYARPWVTL